MRAGARVPARWLGRGATRVRVRRGPSGRIRIMPQLASRDGVVISQEGANTRARAGNLNFLFTNSEAAAILEAYENSQRARKTAL